MGELSPIRLVVIAIKDSIRRHEVIDIKNLRTNTLKIVLMLIRNIYY